MRKLITLLLVYFIIASRMNSNSCLAYTNIIWTEDEISFIDEHPVIRIGIDPGFVPFEFVDKDGEYKGIAAEYLSIISKKTGIQFKIVKGLTWPEAYDLALSGNIDVLPAISKTDERELHFLFTEPYYHFKRVIVTRDNDRGISGIEDLEGQTVAVQRNSSHHSYLLSRIGTNLSLYDSVEAALTAVANGTERAFVGNLATTNYLIRSNGLTNLKFTAFEAEKQQALNFAVRKDWPELVSILNKALDTVTEEEKIAINNKWIDLVQEADYGPFIRIIIIVSILVSVVIVVSFYWIIRLRTEVQKRKLIQMDLEKAKQDAVEANEFKSNFMARMSHEIRTPLNAITGMAYLLKKTQLTLTQKMYTDRITQASSNMLGIINDILDISKIEAGKVELEITSFSMDQVIHDVVNIVSYKIEEQEISFKLFKDPLVPNWFFGDSKRIEQVLLNVLNNAAKFTSAGEVSLDIRLIATEKDKYYLSFSVKDTGIGMNEEQVKNLFKPFTQGDISINRRFGGSGLGLSIVKNLVDMMEGQIQVFSTPGEGTTFIIHLSLNVDKDKEDEYVKTLSAGHFKNIRALVLEKKTGSSMNLISSYLSAFGMYYEITSSKTSAMNMLEAADDKFTRPFDLLIVDYDTPLDDGFKFIETVRNNIKIVKEPKIIMLLPMMREDLFDKLNEYGVDIGIGRPIIPSILFNVLLDIFKFKEVATTQPSVNDINTSSVVKNHCVLVVEDNKTNQLIAKSLLQQAGIESILASDGKAAIELFRQHINKIDLILMDLHMPVMTGYEATQEIRNISVSVPIVAMTADVILGVKEKCEKCGFDHYISKPFDPVHFIQTIKDIIMENEKNYLQDLDILDQSVGLKNMGGNIEIYHQVLKEYLDENRNTLYNLLLCISEKRYADAAQIVHKVKSSSGSIGAIILYDLSVKLQKALDVAKEDDIFILQKKYSILLRKLLEEISKLVD